MFPATWGNLERGLAAVRAFVRTGDASRILLNAEFDGVAPDQLASALASLKEGAPLVQEWRISDHVAAIGRVYALYENFIDELLSSWVEIRVRNQIYAHLPDEWRRSYQAGFSFILPLAGEGRYEHLSQEMMITEQAKALSGDLSYRTFAECMLHRNANLRYDILASLMARCQIGGLDEWLSKSAAIAEYLGGKAEIPNRVSKRLKIFVEYRNDASHSSVSVDSILGVDEIIDIVDFIEVLCSSIREKVNFVASEQLIDRGEAREIGVVTKRYSENVFIATIEGAKLSVGDKLLLRSPRSCSFRTIVNLQEEGADVETVTVATKPMEVGIKFDSPGRVSDKLIVLTPIISTESAGSVDGGGDE